MPSEITLPLVLFFIGFYILVKGADFLVRGASAIARLFSVSTWFVGAVIVGIGTSIPELSVNIASAFSGSPIGVATILGSNMFNVLVVLGSAAFLYTIRLHKSWVLNDFLMHTALTFLTALFILRSLIGPEGFYGIARGEGAVMLGIVILWFILLMRRKILEKEEDDVVGITFITASILFLAGFVGVFVGGRWVVDGAVIIAGLAGVSESVIGLTVVALGTSLPELAVSISAFRQGAVGIAVGNVVGSSIINLLGILGVTALIRPIALVEPIGTDVGIVMAMSVFLFVVAFWGRKYVLTRKEGFLFLLTYAVYIAYLFLR